MKYKEPNLQKIKDEMTRPIKPDNKDVGTCLRYKGKEQIFRSKFKNAKDAQEQFEKLKRLGVTHNDYVVYKCPECGLWHFGKKEWENE